MVKETAICTRCGIAYPKRQGFFPVSYASLYKGVGFLGICRECVESIYNEYVAQCNAPKMAMRQLCRKLDLYWSDDLYIAVSRQSSTRSLLTRYLVRIASVAHSGKTYDDTLKEEGTFWSFGSPEDLRKIKENIENMPSSKKDSVLEEAEETETPKEVVDFWGYGYSSDMYEKLEQRRAYYMSKLPKDGELDIGSEVLIRQICNLEVSIAKDSASDKSIDKSINSLNTLLGSLNLRPIQKKDDGDSSLENTPIGVWTHRWENLRPVPETDPELKDVDGIIRYISIWFLGHLCKMLGIRNSYCRLYEEEIEKLRIDRPEYDDDDDETMFNNIFSTDVAEEDD